MDNFNVAQKVVNTVTRKYFKNKEEQKDIAQDCLIKICNKKDKYNASKAKFSTWTSVVVKNHCIDELRKKNKANNLISRVDISDLNIKSNSIDIFHDDNVNYSYELFCKITPNFNNKHIEILNFCKLQGHSYKKTAIKFNTTDNNIRTIVYRTIQAIKKQAKQMGLYDEIILHIS